MTWKRMAALCIGVACLSASVHGSDWAQFRGPNNSGVASESQAPSEWSVDKNLAWKEKIPGYGWSSPIVVGDKISVTTAVTEQQNPPQAFGRGRRGFGPPGRQKAAATSGGAPKGPPPGAVKGA